MDENKMVDTMLTLNNPDHPGCVMIKMMKGEECLAIGVLSVETLPGFIDSLVFTANKYAEKRLQGVYGGDMGSEVAVGEGSSN